MLLKIVLIAGLMLLPLFSAQAENEDPALQILALKEKIIEIQNQGELEINNLLACSKIMGFGAYIGLESPRLKAGDRLFIYFEPVNFFTKKTDGKYEISLSEDMLILNDKGEILWGKESAVTHNYISRNPILDVFLTNAIDIQELPPGKYAFKATLNDKLKGKTATKSLFFEVAPP